MMPGQQDTGGRREGLDCVLDVSVSAFRFQGRHVHRPCFYKNCKTAPPTGIEIAAPVQAAPCHHRQPCLLTSFQLAYTRTHRR